MDPFLLSLAAAVATGVSTVAGKLIEEGVVKPALEPATEQLKTFVGRGAKARAKQEALANAILAAIEDASEVEGETDGVRYAREIGLQRLTLKSSAKLRRDVMGLVFLASSLDNDAFVGDALLRDLRLQPEQRKPLARFLYHLREHLYEVAEFRPLLDLRHQENVENALHTIIPYLATLGDTFAVVDGKRVVRTTVVAPAWKPRAYLEALANEFSRMRLSIIDPRLLKSGEQPITLDQIYTALDVEEMVPLTKKDKEKLERERGMVDREQRRLTALEAVSAVKDRCVVLLGYPGSGKSTFVNFLGWCLVQEQLAKGSPNGLKRLNGWTRGARLPARIVLRELIAWADKQQLHEATAQTLWDYLAQVTRDLGYGHECDALKKHLQEDGGIVLLDGLDEVREADQRREFIKHAIEKFAGANASLRLIATCRPYAYQRDEWKLENFRTHTLATFSRAQTQEFIRVWYRVIGPREGWNEARINEKTNALVTASQLPHLQDLASRPLLLTLMATLHTAGQLPEDRADLYDKSVKLLLDAWQSDKGGGLSVFDLNAETVERILAHVAFGAHAAQGASQATRQRAAVADIPRETLREAFKAQVKSGDRAEEVVEYIQKRAGLLVAQDNHTYTFPHRSFQEFTAACAAVESPDFPDDLVQRVVNDRDWWREVYLLAAGRARAPRFSNAVELLDCLCGESPPHTPDAESAVNALLAAQAASEVRLASRVVETPRFAKTLRRLQEWLLAMIQQEILSLPERAEAGRVLAALGDIRPDVACAIPEMVDVPASEFVMGSTDEDVKKLVEQYGEGWKDWGKWEIPQHRVKLNGYRIGKYPVTNAQYRRFVEDDGYCVNTEKWRVCWTDDGWKWREKEKIEQPMYFNHPDWNLPNHPVVGVTWYEAVAYCNWLSATDTEKRVYRLPTEAEWEKAARGTDAREYPWEGDFDSAKANTSESEIRRTTAVGLFPRGACPYGALDMAGNVWEWCADWFGSEYYKDSPKENPQGPASGDYRVLRGGSWLNLRVNARCANRYWDLPVNRLNNIGFRVALSFPRP
ncbi:MAG: SUMF1/EgtB/PvdO family nonheme iron enzyme [Chloroflexi bacterium]|nr:SUMF1/EgtB/PvdO family nonheme iron enzyme [Chloroflexota bacterium]